MSGVFFRKFIALTLAGTLAFPSLATTQLYKKNPRFFNKILEQEQQLRDNGYVTFYHGQGATQRIPIELDTFLYSLTQKKVPDTFLFLHTKQHPCPLLPTNKDSALHTQLLNNSLPENSQHLLFLNDSMQSNEQDPKKNCLYYFFNNRNDLGYNFDLYTIFANYGLEHHAEQFLPRLAKLLQDYVRNVSRYGTLYLLAIPKNSVHKSVIPADSDGCLQPIMVDGQPTTDMQKICTARTSKQSPKEKEFTMLMTHNSHGGSNPDSGLLVFPYIMAHSQKKLDAWTKAWNATLDELAATFLASKKPN